MTTILSQLMAAYLEWQGAKRGLTGPASRRFDRWVAEVKPQLFVPYRDRPAEFSLQCAEIKRICSGPPPERGLGPGTLRQHAAALVTIYSALPEAERSSFLDFLDSVQKECSTPRSLLRYIATHLPNAS